MEDASLITKIRQKYNLLLFLVLTSIPLFLWALLMILEYFAGLIFVNPDDIAGDLFTVFVFPLIVAPIISALALLVAKLMSIPILRWIVVVGLGVITPLVVFLLVFLAHFITRKIYIGNLDLLPSIISEMTDINAKRKMQASEEPSIKLAKLKKMLDDGLISQRDYEIKKSDILSGM